MFFRAWTHPGRVISGLIPAILAALALGWSAAATPAQAPPSGSWRFAVSGDSRNCGDVVMPAIARAAADAHAAFFWHLGDFRKTSGADEDIAHEPEHAGTPLSSDAYHAIEWQDFLAHQVAPFGAMPVFLGIGNHDVIRPFTREQFDETFGKWLDQPVLHAERLKDSPDDPAITTYFHWIQGGVAFYFLDNASTDQLDQPQLTWFERVLAADVANPGVHSFVVGMHKPLPNGYTTHSMDEAPHSAEVGRRVYADLLSARDASHKPVYVLASHQHSYLPDAYDTPYWRDHGGVLPGWVVGTAGAVRYALPDPSPAGALTNVYGTLVGTVAPDGRISFEFVQVHESDVPAATVALFGADFAHWCFAENSSAR